MSLLQNLPHTVTHTRYRYEQDEYLGSRRIDSSLASGVSAWVQNASMAEIEQYEKQDQQVTHKVFYASDPGIRPGDVIEVTAGPSFVGVRFDYSASADRSAGLGVLWGVMVKEENNLREAFDD